MWSFIKKYYWAILVGIGVIFFAVVLRDMDRVEELKAFFRRKKVEDDVLKIKEVIAKTEGQVSATDAELERLAEAHQEEVGNAKNASEEDIYNYYKKFFNK